MTYRALVVEDDHDLREVVRDVVEGHGHECHLAGSQEEAEKLLSELAFSYVLLDLHLPLRAGRLGRVETGFILLEQIRSAPRTRKLPVIVMTAHGKDHDHCRRALRMGANNFIKKPFETDSESLDDMIRELLAGAPSVHAAKNRPADVKALKAALWSECILILDEAVVASTRSGARAKVHPSDSVRRALEALLFDGRDGSRFDDVVRTDKRRRSLASDVRKFLRATFDVDETSANPLVHQNKRYVCRVKLRDRDGDRDAWAEAVATADLRTRACKSCKDPFEPWPCEECAAPVEDRCATCHVELAHDRLS